MLITVPMLLLLGPVNSVDELVPVEPPADELYAQIADVALGC